MLATCSAHHTAGRSSLPAVRVAEFHEMHPGGGLRDPNHYDVGSLITVDVMLEEAEAGGRFQTLEPSGRLLSHRFKAGDALVFQGHKYHCVSPVKKGRRRVLVVELWRGRERCCGHRWALTLHSWSCQSLLRRR
eukprot:s1476_g2.t2